MMSDTSWSMIHEPNFVSAIVNVAIHRFGHTRQSVLE
jgi:hypothetical protein